MEAYQILLKAFGSRMLTFEGRFHTFRDVPIVIEPLQRPHPPLWYGAVNADGAAWAAKSGINIVCNGPTAMARDLNVRYRAEWATCGKSPADLPLLGMNRYLVLADSAQAAQAIADRAYKVWRQSFYYLWDKRGGLPGNLAAIYPDTFAEAQQRGYAVAGTPEVVREVLQAQLTEAGSNYLVCRFAFGDLSLSESLNSLDLFARAVAPALTAVPAAAE
jgi:alkanesulfonate monooxygenase SsuD/methylene tetrahydromethanopterin reductase-like flavin-dependent oxidoreductase (luciferase family)